MKSGKVKVALIGTGNWAQEHARIFKARTDMDLVAICGRDPNKTANRADQYATRDFTDINTMLLATRPDLVSICLPNQSHYEPTLQVIRAGVPLLVEKPLVFDLKQADSLLAEAESRKLFFAINFNHHYAQPVAMAHQAILSGRLGAPMFASWRFGGTGGTDHPFNNLIETQCHGFDMLEYLCGPIDSVMAQLSDQSAAGVYRTVSIALHFANGAVGSLLGSYDTSYAYPLTHSVEVSGTKGRLLIEDTVRKFSFNEHQNETAQVWQAGYFNDRDRSFYQTFDKHMDAMLAAFKAGNPPPVHAMAGKRALELAMAAVQSFRSGTRVSIDQTSYWPSAASPITAPPPTP